MAFSPNRRRKEFAVVSLSTSEEKKDVVPVWRKLARRVFKPTSPPAKKDSSIKFQISFSDGSPPDKPIFSVYAEMTWLPRARSSDQLLPLIFLNLSNGFAISSISKSIYSLSVFLAVWRACGSLLSAGDSRGNLPVSRSGRRWRRRPY